ncbi:Transcription factor ORG3 [Platanthera zijinensis]|uniref:Transcription factor ORG3 n=1 Tax=Platanthera zijinensis TaxID=2320716 RepID=A0AAP0C2K0_9ASPA
MADLRRPSSVVSPSFWPTESVGLFELCPEDLSTSQYSLSPTSPLPPELEFSGRKSFLSGAATAGTSLNHREKDSHNAYERNCRRRLNDLYSSLRSLLPQETPQKRKLSIPSTVSRVLKYIPELQRRVKQLQRKKEEILSKAPSIAAAGKIVASPAISALCLSEKEIMVQICMVSGSGGAAGGAGEVARASLCRVLRGLEEEGLQLMNGSSISTDDGRVFHSLHLQARGSIKMDGRIFCEHLMIGLKEE